MNNPWWDFIEKVTFDSSSHQIARRMNDGTSQATINRWKSQTRPDPEKVISFCNAYNVNTVNAFLVLGWITEEDIKDYIRKDEKS